MHKKAISLQFHINLHLKVRDQIISHVDQSERTLGYSNILCSGQRWNLNHSFVSQRQVNDDIRVLFNLKGDVTVQTYSLVCNPVVHFSDLIMKSPVQFMFHSKLAVPLTSTDFNKAPREHKWQMHFICIDCQISCNDLI